MKTYYYYINKDERGEFNADVRDENDNTVFETDEQIFEDGFLRNKTDISGLEKHLKSLEIIGKNDNIRFKA